MSNGRPALYRRRYLINARLQLKYAALVLFFALVVGAVTGMTIYHSGWTVLGEKLARVYPQGHMAGIMQRANLQVLVNLGLLVPFVVLSSILLSHRVAGPLYRVEQALTQIGGGDLDTTIQLRRGDELQNIAEAVNTMTENLRDRLEGHRSVVQSISREVDELIRGVQSGTATNSDVSKRLETIQTQLASLGEPSKQQASEEG